MFQWGCQALFAAILCGLLAWVAPPPVSAQDQATNPFEVRGITVDVTATTAAAAREEALAQAERRAFEALLERLTLPSEGVTAKRFSDVEIASATRDFWVSDERVSPIRYLATLNFSFRPQRVQELLASRGVPFVAATAPPVLVVPVLEDSDGTRPWQGPTPWAEAWREVVAQGLVAMGLVPIVLPTTGGVEAMAQAVEEALAGEEEALMSLARRHRVDDVVVATAVVTPSLTSGAVGETAAPAQGVSVVVRQTRRLGFEGSAPAEVIVHGQEGESVSSLLLRAATQTLRALETEWKLANLRPADSSAITAVDVAVFGLPEWLRIQRRLEAVRVVRRIDPVMLTRDRVRINIHHSGTVEELASQLRAAGFTVGIADEVWTLAAVGGSTFQPASPR